MESMFMGYRCQEWRLVEEAIYIQDRASSAFLVWLCEVMGGYASL
jgi:hypothetical protein